MDLARTKCSCLLLFFFYICVVFSMPLPKNKHHVPYPDNLMSYLTQFGYLPESDRETGYLRTEDQLKEAVKELQRAGSLPATGIVDPATMHLMSLPRCGVKDIIRKDEQTDNYKRRRKKRFAIQGQRWNSTNITWSLRTKYFPNGLDIGRLRADLHKALHLWSQHSKLSFKEVNSDRADILVYFQKGTHGDGFPFDGLGQILAHAFFPGAGLGGDVHFDVDEIWQLSGDDFKEDGTNLFAVAAHEFGHSLGLQHSSVSSALMYPWYRGIDTNYELPDDDRYGIQQIYGRKEKLWGKNYGEKPQQRWPPRDYPNRGKEGQPSPPLYPATTRRTTTTTTTTTTKAPETRHTIAYDEKPDTCDTNYDAVSIIRGELFIFKDKYLWRIGSRGLYKGYPALTSRLWHGLPRNFTSVDAVYERLHDRKIVFFIGHLFYVFDGDKLEPGYPKPLTALGINPWIEKIDAAMVWGHNSKTYLFSGNLYWRLDEDIGTVELDYPRDMSIWKGIGHNIDAVFQWKDGATYFFKGNGYWKFNDLAFSVYNQTQSPSAQFWMGCPNEREEGRDFNELPTTEKTKTKHKSKNPNSSSVMQVNYSLIALCCFILHKKLFFVFF